MKFVKAALRFAGGLWRRQRAAPDLWFLELWEGAEGLPVKKVRRKHRLDFEAIKALKATEKTVRHGDGNNLYAVIPAEKNGNAPRAYWGFWYRKSDGMETWLSLGPIKGIKNDYRELSNGVTIADARAWAASLTQIAKERGDVPAALAKLKANAGIAA